MVNFSSLDFEGDDDEKVGSGELDRYFDTACNAGCRPRRAVVCEEVRVSSALAICTRSHDHPRLVLCETSSAHRLAALVGVAIERVFSGGRDTIFMRRTRLNPDTVRALMLVKHHLRLQRKEMEKALSTLMSDAEGMERLEPMELDANDV